MLYYPAANPHIDRIVLLFSFECCATTLSSRHYWCPISQLAIFFWMLSHKRKTAVLLVIDTGRYILLFSFECCAIAKRRASTRGRSQRLAIFFWMLLLIIVYGRYLDASAKIIAISYLLFSFECCLWSPPRLCNLAPWTLLAIFFWMLYKCVVVVWSKWSWNVLAIFFWMLCMHVWLHANWNLDLPLAIFFWMLSRGDGRVQGHHLHTQLAIFFWMLSLNILPILLITLFIISCYFLLNVVRWNTTLCSPSSLERTQILAIFFWMLFFTQCKLYC